MLAPVRFIIYGAGGIGGTIGGRLHQHGYDVVLIARGGHYDALAERGLDLRFPSERLLLDVPVVDHPAKIDHRSDDVVLLTMKSQDTAGAVEALAGCDFAGAVVCAQNGVDNERQALRRFAKVYAMCVQLPATFLQDGVVICHSEPVAGVLDVGCFPGGIDDTATFMAEALTSSGFLSEADPDVMSLKYTKLLANVGNAIDAACGKAARLATLGKALRAETKAVYAAAGIRARESDAYKAKMAHIRMDPVDGFAHQGSSSWQSLARGTGSIEADHLNGEIVLLGRLHGVATPVNALMQQVANEMARDGRAPASYTVEELEARLPTK